MDMVLEILEMGLLFLIFGLILTGIVIFYKRTTHSFLYEKIFVKNRWTIRIINTRKKVQSIKVYVNSAQTHVSCSLMTETSLDEGESISFDCPHTVGDYSPIVIYFDGHKIEKTFKDIRNILICTNGTVNLTTP